MLTSLFAVFCVFVNLTLIPHTVRIEKEKEKEIETSIMLRQDTQKGYLSFSIKLYAKGFGQQRLQLRCFCLAITQYSTLVL